MKIKTIASGLIAPAAHAQCLVCEKTLTDSDGFAHVKHGEWTVLLCSERCMNAFYAQQLPAFRRLALLAAHPSLQWPRAASSRTELTATP